MPQSLNLPLQLILITVLEDQPSYLTGAESVIISCAVVSNCFICLSQKLESNQKVKAFPHIPDVLKKRACGFPLFSMK